MDLSGIQADCLDPDHVKASLARDGFGMVRGLFERDEVREVEQLLDEMSAKLRELLSGRHRHPFAGDTRPLYDEPHDPDRMDQFEIKFAGSLEPRLLESRLFRKCASFAQAISGSSISRSFDHLIIKSARNSTVTPWHQDVAFNSFGAVRRAIQPSRLHFWIPLQDVSMDTGCMEFIAGSHLQPLLPHNSFARQSGGPGFVAESVDESRRIACCLPVGGATVHTPHTLHYCGRNNSDKPRKAWIIQFSRFGKSQIALKSVFGGVPGRLS